MGNSVAFLVVTVALLGALALIAGRVYSRRRKEETERPKYRMLEDD